MKITIYALLDPRDCAIRYIGLTRDLKARLRHYRNKPHTKHLVNWFSMLKNLGLFPRVEILEEVDEGEAAEKAEREWIAFYRSCNCDLINFTLGGENAFKMTDEMKARKTGIVRRDRGLKRKPRTEETKRRISESRKRAYADGQIKSVFSGLNKSRRGIPLSDEHRRRVSRALKGKVTAESTKEKLRETSKHLWEDVTFRERLLNAGIATRFKKGVVNRKDGGARSTVSQSGS